MPGEPTPAGHASGPPNSRPRGSRATGTGDSEGAGTRFELDFSECLALSWPGNTGLEEMLKAVTGGSAPETAGSAAPTQSGRPAEEREETPLDAAPSSSFSVLAGRVVEDMRPGPGLAGWLSRADAGQLPGYELAGAAAACRRLASWATATELTLVAEMTAQAAARDSAVPAGADGRPAKVSDEAAAEVSLALTMSHFGAAWWADLALALRWRLPGTFTAFSEGRIDLTRARLIADLTSVLSDADARAVEARVVGGAEHQTSGQLRAALRRAVISVDPAAAERRREEAERRARVGLYADEEGTATLAGHNLPGVQACAAMARITALAQAMKAAGAGGGIDLLRAQVLIGLLLDTLPGIPPPLEDPAAPGPSDPGQGGPRGRSADDHPSQGPEGLRNRPSDGESPPEAGHGRREPPRDSAPRNSPEDGRNPAEPPRDDGGPEEPPEGGHRPGEPPRDDGGPGEPPEDDGRPVEPRAGDRKPGRQPKDNRRAGESGPREPRLGPRDAAMPPGGRNGSPVGAAGPQAQPEASQDGRRTRAGPGLPREDECFWNRDPPDGVDDDVGGDGRDDRDTWDDFPQRDDGRSQIPVGPAPAWPPLPMLGDIGIAASGWPSGHAGRVTMEVPWRTLAGMSAEPGHISWLGPITPKAARQLGVMAAVDSRAEWRVIVTDRSGRALLITRVPRRDHATNQLGADLGSRGPGLVSRITLTLSLELVNGPPRPASAEDEPSGAAGLQKVLAAALSAARKAVARAQSEARARNEARAQSEAGGSGRAGIAAGMSVTGCSHHGAEPHYRPSDRLRELVIARDRTCRSPRCRQPAWQADLDHTIPFGDGGLTCRCNLGPVCRREHKIKQRPGWRLDQPEPGIFEWTTPAGRRYRVTPDLYPL
jgi:Domain of unknown function (DUF222)